MGLHYKTTAESRRQMLAMYRRGVSVRSIAHLHNLNPSYIYRVIHEEMQPPMCESCGVNRSDPPSKLCPGCQAYQEHQQ